MPYSIDESLRRIRLQNDAFRSLAQLPPERLYATAPAVSSWSTAEHLDHSIRVATSVARKLMEENPKILSRPVTLVGRVVLALGWIPRGRGKAPEKLLPQRVSREEIVQGVEALEQILEAAAAASQSRPGDVVMPHPFFGGLTPPQAWRFVVVHSHHHLKIVKEVLRG